MSDSYFANFNYYTHMTHYVAKVLGQRPNDILDTWSVPELVVAYGQYRNEQANSVYAEWKSLSAKDKKSVPRPKEYDVAFYAPDDLAEEGGSDSGD